MTCPEGFEYNICGAACPATCVDRQGPSDCPMTHCVETCQCPAGMVLDGDQCVSTYQCGCTMDDGMYLSVSYNYSNIGPSIFRDIGPSRAI